MKQHRAQLVHAAYDGELTDERRASRVVSELEDLLASENPAVKAALSKLLKGPGSEKRENDPPKDKDKDPKKDQGKESA